MATKRRSNRRSKRICPKTGRRPCKCSKRKKNIRYNTGRKRQNKKSCKYGKLKRQIKTKYGRKRRCRKIKRRTCKYGKLKRSKRTKSGGKRRCKKKGKNPYFNFANKHRKNVMKKLKNKGFEGRELVIKTAKELGKMYKQSQS
tara:strand:- start:973 stop:1401 length:429 start_codon:yes stop_codon:yes gene_type:complete